MDLRGLTLKWGRASQMPRAPTESGGNQSLGVEGSELKLLNGDVVENFLIAVPHVTCCAALHNCLECCYCREAVTVAESFAFLGKWSAANEKSCSAHRA